MNDPETLPTLVFEHWITAVPMVALEPASERLAPAVALDLVPLPVGSRPLLPGPAAKTAELLGPRTATASVVATASQPRPRPSVIRVRRRVGRAFIVCPNVAAIHVPYRSLACGMDRYLSRTFGDGRPHRMPPHLPGSATWS